MSRETLDQPRVPRRKSTVNGARPFEPCPRCGRSAARIVGGSESFAVLYLRCDDCQQMSVAPS